MGVLDSQSHQNAGDEPFGELESGSTSADGHGSSRRHDKESRERTMLTHCGGSCAVVVEKGTKFYGKGRSRVTALNGLSMRIPHATIYGLLGPSGCGKTTLLGCLVNRLQLDKGNILLFGFPPGSKESGVPGGRVGYMPQELALYQEFAVKETLEYFGRLLCLSNATIKHRTEFLVSFLDLPDPKRLINQLSGGQQRRVSLAVALLHEPELLILDEPTVGVDPLLRASIWSHLMKVSRKGNTTIVITTHYIEEARQAGMVGLMRKGRLLAETTPDKLMEYFSLISLEDAFMKLCALDGDSHDRNQKDWSEKCGSKTDRNDWEEESSASVFTKPWGAASKRGFQFSYSRTKALVIKNFIRMSRSLMVLGFLFLLPPLQSIMFCVTVGDTPHDLPMAVVNLDEPLLVPRLSDSYLDALNPSVIQQKMYSSFDAGYESVENGKTWGMIFFNQSFSHGIIYGDDDSDGTIHVYMDNTNQEIAVTIKIVLYRTLEESIKRLFDLAPGLEVPESLSLPLKMEDPVYAIEDSTFRNFVAPGVLLTIIFFLAVGLTSFAFLQERKEGLLERSWVSGVKTSEIVTSHLITQVFVMSLQIMFVLIFMFPVFKIPCEGSMAWVVLLSLLQGVCGMCFGLMISGISTDEQAAIQLILGTFYPIILMSGIVWPVEGMPNFLRYISYILPQTFACEGLRGVMYRGWGLAHFDVYMGFIVTIAWTCLFVGMSLFTAKL